MHSKTYITKIITLFLTVACFASACKGTEPVVPDENKPDEKEPDKEEPAYVSPVTDLKAEKTEKANELIITWTYPKEAISTEITWVLEGTNPSDVDKKNVMRPSDDKGSFRMHVLQHGKYIISAVAIDSDGNRSETVTTDGVPTHENDVLLVFPEGADALSVGTRLARRFIKTISSSPHNTRTNYPYVCTYLGAFQFAQAIGDDQMYNELLTRYDNSFFSAGAPTLPSPNHVDNNVFGSVPLEIYKKVKDRKYFNLGMDYADKQWELPANPTQAQQNWHNQGYSWQTRIWIDDMFMITAIQAQAYQTTSDRKYIDRAAKEMVMYLDEIQRPNGLFYHAPDAPFYWARGNGWMAVGMANLLSILPEDNPNQNKIETAYKLMMSTLLQHQAEDGMWRQLIDKSELWKETSGTAMFTYAMIVGVKKGWLDKVTYGTAARKAWLTLLTYINSDDNVTEVCEGTNKNSSYQFYVDRKRNIGDLHGQAPMLWCATALYNDM